MSKGSGFTRVVSYFRTVDLTEAQACLTACTSIVTDRAFPSEPKLRRKRRTKAQITADSAQERAQGATA